MQLLIIRHAIAIARGTPGISDDARPLTDEGEHRFRAAACGLAQILEAPDAILTSPLPRARRTAEIAAHAWRSNLAPVDTPALIEACEVDVRRLLARQRKAKLIAIVGHEPSLSALLAGLLGASDGERFAIKKGGAVLLELHAGPRAGARLLWALPPRILRALA
jgi:phosphohistidine phosphatase